MPTGHRLTVPQVTEMRELLKVGISYDAIAKKFGVSHHTIGRIKRDRKFKGSPVDSPQAYASLPKAAAETSTNGNAAPEAKPAKPQGLYVHHEPEIMKLKAEGLGVGAVAQKLGIPKTAVNYYFYGKKKHNQPVQSQTSKLESSNGHQHLDQRFLVGFGCAELERTLTAIAQRLGIPANLLRQGFSRFLGSAPVR